MRWASDGPVCVFDRIWHAIDSSKGSPIAFLKLKPTSCNTVTISTDRRGSMNEMIC